MENFILTNGKLLEDFSSIGQWIVDNSTISTDIVNFKQGTSAIKLDTTMAGITASMTKTISVNLSAMNNLYFWCYIEDKTLINYINIYISSSPWSKYFSFCFDQTSDQVLKNGWNLLQLSKNEFVNEGIASWSNIMTSLRFSVNPVAGKNISVTFDLCVKDQISTPKCVFTFDDGYIGTYTKAYPKMEVYGLKGTSWIIPTLVNSNDINYMRKTHLTDLMNNGWEISNHTLNHTKLSELTTDADIINEIQGCINWLNLNGYTKWTNYISYPLGGYNDNVINIAKSLGIECARSCIYGYQSNPIEDLMTVKTFAVDRPSTFTKIKFLIDNAVLSGASIIFMFHNIADTPILDNDVSTALFNRIVDYVVTVMDVVTYGEWYQQSIGIKQNICRF